MNQIENLHGIIEREKIIRRVIRQRRQGDNAVDNLQRVQLSETQQKFVVTFKDNVIRRAVQNLFEFVGRNFRAVNKNSEVARIELETFRRLCTSRHDKFSALRRASK